MEKKQIDGKYKSLVEIIPDIVYELDAEGKITYVNDAIKELGCSAEGLVGKHMREIIHPDDFKRVSAFFVLPKNKGKINGAEGAPGLFDERRTGERATRNLEVRLVFEKTDKGSLKDYWYGEVYSSGKWDRPVNRERKRFLGSIGIIRNMRKLSAALKKTEGQRDKALWEAGKIEQERLEELESSYRRLQESKDQLVQSEKLAFAGRMAASVAHEIRNPLNMMVMSVELLQRQSAKDNSNRELAEIIMRNLKRIDFLVTELVNCARPPRLRIRKHNMHTIINSVIATIEGKCKECSIRIIKDFASGIPAIRIDREHIEHTILNMAKNAMEAMPKKGDLIFSTGLEGDNLVVKIIDTGRVIPEKDMINIFDPFFTTKKGGTGLGLTICYATIASHRGFIDVESKRGRTCFTIVLPLAREEGGGEGRQL